MTKKGMSTEGTDRRLHRYFDGDLSPEERAALAAEIAEDDVLSRKLTALGDVGTLVRAAADQPLTEADSASMWAAIARGADLDTASAPSEAKAARPSLRLITGQGLVSGQGRAPAPSTGVKANESAPASRAPAPVEDLAARRRRRVGVAIGGLALAAAALLAFLPSNDPAPEEIARPITEEPVLPFEEILDPPDSMRTEVLAVDFGTNVGTIFAVEGTAGQRYAVVWLDDAVKIDDGPASPEEQPN